MTKEALRNLKSKLDGNVLDLSCSHDMNEIPVKELAEIPKATCLDLSFSKIVALPQSFCTLTHLVQLDLSKNLIRELPLNFGQLENLVKLDLYDNEIEVLPASFSQLKRLKWLDLKDNPLKPQLRDVAGDCLDSKECQQCARKVVNFMVEVCNQIEKERIQRLAAEKAKEEAKKLAEEKEKEKARLAKKAKKRKLAELKVKQEKDQISQSSKQDSDAEPVANDRLSNHSSVKSSEKQKEISLFVWLFLIMGLSIALGIAVLWHYTQLDLSEERLRLARIQIKQDTDTFLILCSDINNIVTDAVKYGAERTIDYTSEWYIHFIDWFDSVYSSSSEQGPPLVNEQNDPITWTE